MELDRTDYRILHHIQNNARMTNVDLAEAIGLSPAPCLRRVKALEAAGVIKCYAGIVDAGAVGLPISIFINISWSARSAAIWRISKTAFKAIPK